MQRRTLAVMFLAIGVAAAENGAWAQDAPPPTPAEASASEPIGNDANPARAEPQYLDLRRTRPIVGDAAAGREKAQVCVACHGENGISIAPIFPNLVGQSAEYVYWSLVEYKRARGPQSAMTPLVTPLSDRDMRDLAAYYAQFSVERTASQPSSGSDEPADPKLVEAGQRIFEEGNAQRGVPPCQGCHGVDASGHPLAKQGGSARARAFYRTYPPLKSQKADYIVTRLTQYRDEQLHDSSNDFVMQSVAAGLDDESIRSVAAWLSSRR